MCNPHIKFEMSTITCNKEIKSNAKCKNSRFESFFVGLRVTHRVYLWLDRKRVVDFLLAIIELFSLALTAAAPLSEICRNRSFLTGVGRGSFAVQILGRWGPLDRRMM